MADYDWQPEVGGLQTNRASINFTFTTNGALNPTVIGGLGDTAATIPNFLILSIVYAATGKYTITLQPRWLIPGLVDWDAELEDIASPDGAYATIGNFGNEGSSTGALTAVVSTFNGGGTLTQFTGRRVAVKLVIRNSKSSVGP